MLPHRRCLLVLRPHGTAHCDRPRTAAEVSAIDYELGGGGGAVNYMHSLFYGYSNEVSL